MNPHKVAALSLAGLLAGAVLEAQPRPKASELLQQVRSAYSSLLSLRDQGEIEAVHSDTGAVELHTFDLATAAGGGYRFTLQSPDLPGAPSTVVWRHGAQVSVFDSTAGETRAAGSLLAEVVKSYGEGGLDALVVPAFLAGAAGTVGAMTASAASAVDGPSPCDDEGAGRCWVLTLSREGGPTSRLWIDTATSLVRQAEVRLPAGAKRSRIRVRHRATAVNPVLSAADLTFGGLPPKLEPVPEMAAGAAPDESVLWIRGEARQPDEVLERLRREKAFQSEMTVAVAPIVARVYDPAGKPMLGLQPKDFVVRIGKSRKEIPVLAVDWVADGQPLPEEAAPEEPEETVAQILAEPSPSLELMRKMGTPPGKWVLFFIQGDLEPVRIKGHLALLMRIEKLLDTVGKDDRMALVSFDSKLRLRLDWTQDREAVREAFRLAVRTGGDFSFPGDGSQKVSLADSLSEASSAVNPEQALEMVADALMPLPGQKAVLFVGWGLGRATPQGMWYTQTFVRAAEKLNEAQASVFVLDITHDDFHTLAAGLYSMARSTGGTYSATYKFPDRAIKLLAQAMSGYYMLTVDADDLPKNGKPLKIELRNSYRGTVLARPSNPSRETVQITDP